MGWFRRVRDLFHADTQPQDDPERVLNAYIEASSEKLRALSVSVNRSRSEWLTAKENCERLETDMAQLRSKAEEAAKQGHANAARRFLEELHDRRPQAEQLTQDTEKLKERADQLERKFELLASKLETARKLKEQFRLRARDAMLQLEARRALEMDLTTSSAMDQIQEAAFLAEAKAELERT
ncbi:PspA/IM30 family protein [Cohnella zeiphila]|uniref:PspA/IM30 family protein n=1 Tax=Cohnella zeiphila TaxID=2761120 RepID=A0A7X0SRD0_9BACL|nr:PspA/IM30 family protein [Cohnella zeiphila]MBB6734546.1 PspA/IM30 family protein [Cohnella zeiphila]